MFAYAGAYGKLCNHGSEKRPARHAGGILMKGSEQTYPVEAKDMSVLITLLIVGLVIVYLRSNRRARLTWLGNLDLPGQWASQRNDGVLSLSGKLDAGQYQWRMGTQVDQGSWQYRGSTLTLSGGERREFQVQYFQPGVISLTDQNGSAELFHKQTTNVVQLGKR